MVCLPLADDGVMTTWSVRCWLRTIHRLVGMCVCVWYVFGGVATRNVVLFHVALHEFELPQHTLHYVITSFPTIPYHILFDIASYYYVAV